jgi:uncharacterized protein YeaO (DUF488 family)
MASTHSAPTYAALPGRVRSEVMHTPVTLVFSVHDEAHNDAIVLRELLVEGG